MLVSYVILVNYDNKDIIVFESCIDGDTAWFKINGEKEKVRLLGIDTPESTNIKEQFGEEASNYTCNMLKNTKNIYIEYDINSDKRDKYGRLLGWIFVDDNNLSELLIKEGLAEVNYIYGDYKYIDDLCHSQYLAYRKRLGIWSTYDYERNYCYKKNKS